MYKAGNFHGTSAVIYRQSDGINVAIILNHYSGETYDPPGDAARAVTPPPPPAPTWDLVELSKQWTSGVIQWPSINMFPEFF
jgi:hypothetical protein